jgi:hypothetical protein
VLAGRLWTSQSALGALNFYASAPRWFDTDAPSLQKSSVVMPRSPCPAQDRRSHCSGPLRPGTLVGQAQGIIMERFDLDMESAFEGYVATPRTPI